MVKEKTNLNGSKKLKTDLNDPNNLSDLNDTQVNPNEETNDLAIKTVSVLIMIYLVH